MTETAAPAAGPELETAPALVVEDLVKTFPVGKQRLTALDRVSCTIRPHRVTGLIGPDGAGKTTLMRLCAGLLTPDRGSLSVLSIDAITEPLTVQANIGYMPQRFGLYEDLSVQENLDLYADLQGVPRDARAERYDQLLAMAGLAGFRQRLAGRLSGGMKQKLGLVCTLVRPPRLLLLDEPTVGVDPVSRRELWQIVYHLVESEGMSVLLSTAYLDEAERCAEVVLLHQGRILGHDQPQAFSRQVAGRTWTLPVRAEARRDLQRRLSQHPTVLDALILGSSLRVITRADAAEAFASADLVDAGETLHLTPAQPRFEDYFIATL